MHTEINNTKRYEIFNEDVFNVLPKINNNSVDLILTDPPFGQNIQYGRKAKTIKNDCNLDWLSEFAGNMYRILKDDTHCIVFWQWRTYSKLEFEMLKWGFVIKTVAIWDKGKPSLGDGLSEQYEQIVIFKKGKARQSRFRGNVFRYARLVGGQEHPHQKPERLLGDLIMLCSKENDLIFDGFMGSGSVGVASMTYGRRFIGCEIDEEYYKLSEKRIKAEANQTKLF
jgi:DNA modification methylase